MSDDPSTHAASPPGDGAAVLAPDNPFALAEQLAGAETGTPLVGLLESLDPGGLSPFALVEVVHAAARMAAWAHAVQARYAAALAGHPEIQPPPARTAGGRALTGAAVAAQALSMRLNRTGRHALGLVRDGLGFDSVLPETGEALGAGRIDPPRAQAITARLHDQHPEIARDVQERVLPRAADRTAGQVRRDLERALLQVDPAHAAERHAAARDTRHVSHATVEPDGMASFRVHLAAVDAVRIDTTLEACARTARAAGDSRTLAQLRADGLVDLLLAGPGAAAPVGPGPEPAPAREHDGVVPSPGLPGDAPGATDDGSARPAAGTRTVDPRTQVFVTVALSTLLGLDDEPGDLAGYGPVDPTQARALALGGTWRRIITDDRSGALLDLGRTRYRPPAALAEHVRHRDRTCAAPGCLVPAHLADLDHTRDYHRHDRGDPDGPLGTTSHVNLDPLCRHHHRHKTETALHLRQTAPGEYEWTDPTGHRYRTRPGLDAPTEHLTDPARSASETGPDAHPTG